MITSVRLVTVWGGLFGTLMLSGCSDPHGGVQWLGTIDTLPSGVVVVTNPVSGIWDSASSWTLTEELVVANPDSSTTPLLSDVAALEIDSTGRIYVLDRQLSALLMFDRNGTLLKQVGREGEGPGEFRGPNGLGWDRAGRLWVVEGQGARNSIFDRDGRFMESRPRTTGFYGYIWDGQFLASGDMYELVFDREDSYSQPLIARYDSARGLVDSTPLPYTMGGDNFFRFEFKNGYSITAIPYFPAPWFHIDPRGFIWTGNTCCYELTQLTMTGDTVRVIRREHPPIPVGAAERDSAIDRLKEMAQGAPFDEGRIPHVKPMIERIVVSDSGYVFVITAADGGGGTSLDVFDPEGRYLGQMVSSRRIGPYLPKTPLLIRGNRAWSVVVDEVDVPAVVRWKITAPAAEPSGEAMRGAQ